MKILFLRNDTVSASRMKKIGEELMIFDRFVHIDSRHEIIQWKTVKSLTLNENLISYLSWRRW